MNSSTSSVRIRLFASLREQAGWAEREWRLEVRADAATLTPAILWKQLQLPGNCASTRVAINHQLASHNTALKAGDELAFLPPISGG
jgi:molybdopterin synthase sulfur carrier subunit